MENHEEQTGPDFGIYKRIAENLVDIDKDRKLRLSLNDWEKSLKKALCRVEVKRERSVNVKNEVYQLIGFQGVFQGVVLGAVAQASTLTCDTAWGPALLSGLASIATVISVYNKLKEYITTTIEYKKEEKDALGVMTKISNIKLGGSRFKFSSLDNQKSKEDDKVRVPSHYFWLVMIVVVLFSGVVVIVVIAILCSGKSSHDISEPQSLWPQGFT